MIDKINWKLAVVVIVSLFLLTICYLTVNLQANLQIKKETEYDFETKTPDQFKKFIGVQREEDLKKIKIPENHVIYFFPEKCPDYKSDCFLVNTVGGLDKYYLPEENYIIIIKKDHKWTKEPNFIYWKFDPSLNQS